MGLARDNRPPLTTSPRNGKTSRKAQTLGFLTFSFGATPVKMLKGMSWAASDSKRLAESLRHVKICKRWLFTHESPRDGFTSWSKASQTP